MASMMEKLGEKFHGDKKDEHHQQSATHNPAGYGGNVGGQPGYGGNVGGQPGYGHDSIGAGGHNQPGYGHDSHGVGGHNQPGYGHDSHGVSGTGTNYGGTGTNQAPYSAGTTTGQPEKKHEGLVDKIKKKKNPNKVRKEGDKSSSSSESD